MHANNLEDRIISFFESQSCDLRSLEFEKASSSHLSSDLTSVGIKAAIKVAVSVISPIVRESDRWPSSTENGER